MLEFLKKEQNKTFTENGGLTNLSSESACLDLFFFAGASRNSSEKDIEKAVTRAYAEDPEKTMKIIFFARDVRGGLGERRFFRVAVNTLAFTVPESVKANIKYFAEYGRYDDLCELLDTPCEDEAIAEIDKRLVLDIKAMKNNKPVSLLAKWLPSVNASSEKTARLAKKLCKKLGMYEKSYRQTLSALRKYTDIIENRLREKDYSFDYEKQCSGAMFKYRKAFIRNDLERYKAFLDSVKNGSAKLNADTLYPYDIVRKALCEKKLSDTERKSLDISWKSLTSRANDEKNQNAIAVVDGSGSMTWGFDGNIRPIDAAISLGIFFAEHNTGAYANHFITFSSSPRLIEIKGRDIFEKVRYCASYNECSNTDLEKTFDLILRTAVNNHLKQKDMPARMYIISDMEFDVCAYGGNNLTMFEAQKKKFARCGYRLPDVIFWNVNSRGSHIPVTKTETGAALVSGNSPAVFDMIRSEEISPEKIMNDIIFSKRYECISA